MVDTSIIIRAFNEERHLGPLFDAIEQQRFQDFEIIVVDSRSFDRTKEIAESRADRVIQVSRHDFTFGHSLNEGIRVARGRRVAIVSAHTLPVDAGWLEALVSPLDQARTAMVYGRQLGHETSKYSERRDFERVFGPERRRLISPDFFANNANSGVRRDLWEEHPFDEALPGLEDIEWAKHWMQKGWNVVYEPHAALYHIHDETWPQVRRRYYREAQAAYWIGLRKRRRIPGEIFQAAGRTLGDFAHAARAGCLTAMAGEILRFRWNHLAGTLGGTWNGAIMNNPLERERLFFDRPYKAVVIHGPNQASIEDFDVPIVRPSEVLIRVAWLGVCATDLEVSRGRLDYFRTGLAAFPIVPGHEFSGTVAALGSRVEGISIGDPVVVECIQSCGDCSACARGNTVACPNRAELGVMRRNGAYAEYVLTAGRFVHRLPDGLGLREASLCEPLAVVLKGLRRLEHALPGTRLQGRCGIVGAGAIGQLAGRVLRERGQDVVLFDGDARRCEIAQGAGFAASGDLSALSSCDAVIEATGDPAALRAVLDRSAPGATLLLLGLPYASQEYDFQSLVGYDKTVIGSVGSSSRDFEEALRLLPTLGLHGFLECALPLESFQEAWKLHSERKYLKVMLAVDRQAALAPALPKMRSTPDSSGMPSVAGASDEISPVAIQAAHARRE